MENANRILERIESLISYFNWKSKEAKTKEMRSCSLKIVTKIHEIKSDLIDILAENGCDIHATKDYLGVAREYHMKEFPESSGGQIDFQTWYQEAYWEFLEYAKKRNLTHHHAQDFRKWLEDEPNRK